MNNTFNFNRFAMLFKKHSAENYRMYLMSTGVLIGILLLILGYSAYTNEGIITKDVQAITFLNLFFLSGTIFTSSIFASLGDKKKAIATLTLPVSHLEKYLVAWVYSLIVFQLLFLGCFYGVAQLVISIDNSNSVIKSELIDIFDKEQKLYVIFPAYIFLHSICFLGAIFFEKMHFIKTAITFFTFMFLLFLLNKSLVGIIVNQQVTQAVPFSNMHIEQISQRISSTATGETITIIMMAALVILLWTSAYFKLKEKEV